MWQGPTRPCPILERIRFTTRRAGCRTNEVSIRPCTQRIRVGVCCSGTTDSKVIAASHLNVIRHVDSCNIYGVPVLILKLQLQGAGPSSFAGGTSGWPVYVSTNNDRCVR